MGWLQRCYRKVIAWSSHKHASYYLAGISVAESSFFPIPPDALLIPMVMAKPQRAWFYATLTTLSSVLGGVGGYLIGYFAFETFGQAIISAFGCEAQYLQLMLWFEVWGLLVIFLAGATPIPYKLFTIAAGTLQMPLLSFLLGSLVGRAARFYLVAGLLKCSHKTIDGMIVRYLDRVGWFVVIFLLALFILWKLW